MIKTYAGVDQEAGEKWEDEKGGDCHDSIHKESVNRQSELCEFVIKKLNMDTSKMGRSVE